MKRENRLWAALDLLRSGGMVKRLRHDSEGRHCALGLLDAVYYAEGYEYSILDLYLRDGLALVDTARALFPERMAEVDALYGAAMGAPYSWGPDGGIVVHAGTDPIVSMNRIAWFNNHPDTTQADLELVFEKTAIRHDEILA